MATNSRPPSSRRRVEDPNVRLSKEMSKLLRHSPPPGSMDEAGWVSLPVLMRHLRGNVTEAAIREVVNSNDKKRFVLDDAVTPPRIRAAQGHSVALEAPVLIPITDPDMLPVVLHVTGAEGWQAIQSSGELRSMSRTHIHFATQPHHMRRNTWVSVILQLELKQAMEAGFKFAMSSNDVLLCEGPLPVEFVRRVTQADLPPEWQAALPAPKAGAR